MSWECPECGENNAEHITECACGGYVGEVDDSEIINTDYDTSYTEPSIETPATPYAGFWLRFGATVTDSLILLVPTVLLFILLPKEVTETVMPDGNIHKTYNASGITQISIGVLWLMYKAILESSQRQATFGKQALKIVVTNMTGKRLSFSMATFRSWPIWLPWVLGSVKPIVGMFAMVSCIAVGFTRQKQGFHDQMVKCLVVRRGAKFESDDVSEDSKPASTAGQMLYEIKRIDQKDPGLKRRWFYDEQMDLLVWFDEEEKIAGFQLSYDKLTNPHTLTWFKNKGYRHNILDIERNKIGRRKGIPILLLPNGLFEKDKVAEDFKKNSTDIDNQVSKFVYNKILSYKLP